MAKFPSITYSRPRDLMEDVMPFFDVDSLPLTELFPGVRSRLFTGDQVMCSFIEMALGDVVPDHSHPEEQAGYMLEGKLRLRIDGEEKVMAPGDAYLVPANVRHSAEVVEGPVRVLDIFGPPREDYRAKMEGK